MGNTSIKQPLLRCTRIGACKLFAVGDGVDISLSLRNFASCLHVLVVWLGRWLNWQYWIKYLQWVIDDHNFPNYFDNDWHGYDSVDKSWWSFDYQAAENDLDLSDLKFLYEWGWQWPPLVSLWISFSWSSPKVIKDSHILIVAHIFFVIISETSWDMESNIIVRNRLSNKCNFISCRPDILKIFSDCLGVTWIVV